MSDGKGRRILSLSGKLLSIPHREVSGSDAYAAFEFQVMFGVELLFEKYDKLDDYAVLFEFHDDIVLLYDTVNPKSIEFFQLKHTTTGNWSIAKFCKTPPKKKSVAKKGESILQKIYRNAFIFRNFTANAQIVSNAYCNEFGQKTNSKFNTVETTAQNKILEHLKDIDANVQEDCLSILGFRHTVLDKTQYNENIKGRVHTFLQNKIGGDGFQLQACVDAIVSQCRIRNKSLATNITGTFSDIVNQKGVTRKDLSEWIKEIETSKLAADWTIIQPHLGGNWEFFEENSIRNSYQSYKVVALDSSNDAQSSIVRRIRELEPSKILPPFSKSIDTLISMQKLDREAEYFGFNSNQLKAMILYEIFKS